MGLNEAAAAALGAVAWMVAGALALGMGAVVFAMRAHRRHRCAQVRLRQLESAVGEFCEALRGRLALASRGARAVRAVCDASDGSQGEES